MDAHCWRKWSRMRRCFQCPPPSYGVPDLNLGCTPPTATSPSPNGAIDPCLLPPVWLVTREAWASPGRLRIQNPLIDALDAAQAVFNLQVGSGKVSCTLSCSRYGVPCHQSVVSHAEYGVLWYQNTTFSLLKAPPRTYPLEASVRITQLNSTDATTACRCPR